MTGDDRSLANEQPRVSPLQATLGLPRRLRAKFAEVGISYAIFLALKRAFVPGLFEVRSAVFMALDLHDLAPVPGAGEGTIREATEADLQQFLDFGHTADYVLPRLRKGYRAWVIEQDGQWLASDWLSPEAKTAATWLLIDGGPGDLWSAGIKVDPRFRGRRLAPRLRRHIARECAQAGKTRMLGLVDDFNRNSFRALGKIGFEPIGRVFYVSLLGLNLVRFGRHWHLGRWRPEAPLRLGIDGLDDRRPRVAKGP